MSPSRQGFQRNGVPEISGWQRWSTEAKKFKEETGLVSLFVAKCFPTFASHTPTTYDEEAHKERVLCQKKKKKA